MIRFDAIRAAVLGLAVLAVPAAPEARPGDPAWPPTIAAIEIRGVDDPLLEAELLRRIPQQAGDPVLMEELDYTMKLLSLRLDVADVSIQFRRHSPERWTLQYVITPADLIETIRYRFAAPMEHGRDRLPRSDGLAQLPAVYTETQPAGFARQLQRALRNLGYREGRVEPQFHWTGSHTGELELVVRPGPLYRIRSIDWDQPTVAPVRRPELKGRPWDDEQIQSRFRRYLRQLRQAGHLDAHGELGCVATEPKTEGDRAAHCTATVRPGPNLLFHFVGNKTFYDPDLSTALGIDPERRYTTGDLSRRASRLEDFYHRNGFYYADVTVVVEERAAGAEAVVRYHVDEQDRYDFSGIRFGGIDDPELAETLRDAMAISPSAVDRVFFGKSGELESAARKEDLERVVYTLNREGFLQATIAGDRFESDGKDVYWHIEVEPGPRFTWSDLTLPDPSAYGLDLARPEGLVRGAPVNPFELQSYADQWVVALRNEGFLDAFAQADYAAGGATTAVPGRIDLYQGVRYRVAAILVRGHSRTRESAVVDKLPFEEEDVARNSYLLEGRRLLLETRVFQQVQSQWALRDPAVGKVVAIYELRERNGGELELGLLLTTEEGVGVDMRIGHNRLFGTFRSASVEGSVLYPVDDVLQGRFVNTQPERARVTTRYREPLPTRIQLYGDLQGLLELNRNDPDFDWIAANASIGPSWEVSRNMDLGLNYLYEWFKPIRITNDRLRRDIDSGRLAATDATFVDVDEIDRIAGLRSSLFYHDFDNRFDPRDGWSTYHQLQFARQEFGGEFDFLRYEGSVRYLEPLFGTVSFWAGGRLGWVGLKGANQSLPRFKRFRLGGSNSVRGYQREAVSPSVMLSDGSAVSIGGQRFWNTQVEVRVGLSNAFELAVFQDAAQVWGFDNASVLAAGYGAGVLYHTPAGPLRLDYGRKFIKIPTDRADDVIHFYIVASF